MISGWIHTRGDWTLAIALSAAALIGGGIGCTEGPGTSSWGKPMLFPPAARLGDTVAMVIVLSEDKANLEMFSVSRDNVTVRLTEWDDPVNQNIVESQLTLIPDLDADDDGVDDYFVEVMEVPMWPGTAFATLNEGRIGQTMKVVLFNLPDTWTWADPINPAYDLSVEVLVDDQPFALDSNGDNEYSRRLTIREGSGSPIVFGALSLPEQFETRPMYRLAPTHNANLIGSNTGMDPNWNIGAIEFTLRYTNSRLSNPEAFAGGAATGGLVLVGDEVDEGSGTTSVKISLIIPGGVQPFSHTNSTCVNLATGKCHSPAPMIDIAFDTDLTGLPPEDPEGADVVVFDTTDFEITDFFVYNTNGVRLNFGWGNSTEGEHYFVQQVVRNLVDS